MNKFNLLILLFLIIVSCEKEPSQIGMNIQPGEELSELFFKTIKVSSHTILDHDIASNQRSLSPLGEINDPVFGNSKAMFTCQVLLSTSNVDLSSFVNNVNSMKLHLKYNDVYGNNISDLNNIKVYRLLKNISRDTVYNSGFTLNQNQKELITEANIITTGDSLISIEMPENLINEIIDPNNKDYFKNNESFINFFKGIYVEAETSGSSEGAIIYVDLLSPTSRIELNYNDSETYTFEITTSSAIINQFKHNYDSADPKLREVLENDITNNEYSFIQSLGGLKIKIEFPQLVEEFKNKEIFGINKAQLIITIEQDNNIQTFGPPESLNLIAVSQDGVSQFLTDYKVNSSNFGGDLNRSLYQYTFNIPFHIQELIKNDDIVSLHLLPANNRIYAGRAVLYGGSLDAHNDSLRMRLEVLYSK